MRLSVASYSTSFSHIVKPDRGGGGGGGGISVHETCIV